MELLSREFYSIQSWLLPELVEELGELTKKQCEFVRAVELLDPIRFIDKFNWYSLNCLIEDINRYCVDFSNLDKDEYFKKLIMNNEKL